MTNNRRLGVGAQRDSSHVPGRICTTQIECRSPTSNLADFEKVIEASGGYGERVETPEQLEPALARAVRVVKEEKRQALLNVICQMV